MELEIGPFSKYEDIKNHAYWANVPIDTKFKADRECMDDYIAHLKDCERHPTTGFLAKRRYITGKKWNYPECARRNLHFLEKQPEVDALQSRIKEKINTLYPKTKHIREYIINNDRIVLDTVKKSRKYTFLNKLAVMLKKNI